MLTVEEIALAQGIVLTVAQLKCLEGIVAEEYRARHDGAEPHTVNAASATE